jgi:mRNA interferase RelE/StbE
MEKARPCHPNQFTRKLAERLRHPDVPASRLSGLPSCYKIKLRASGFRLVYQVEDEALIVLVIAVGNASEMTPTRARPNASKRPPSQEML